MLSRNPTFWSTRSGELLESLDHVRLDQCPPRLPARDHAWLEREFHEFNIDNGYPEHIELENADCDCASRIISCEATRRYKWELRRKPMRWLCSLLGMRDSRLDNLFLK